MSRLVIDTGIDTAADLAALLPQSVRDRVGPELLREPPSAAALRVLATIRDERWRQYVDTVRIDWMGMLTWSRHEGASPTVKLRVELAASLARYEPASPQLYEAACALDEGNFAALLDALRIAREGLRA